MRNLFHRTHKQEEVNPQTDGLHRSSSSRLKYLVGNDPKMYFALQNFLLFAPERQIAQLGEVKMLLGKGDAARATANNLEACADYETAAKIEIYKQNKDSARNCLILAKEVSEKEHPHHEFQETMLADMDEVLRISMAYHYLAPRSVVR